MNITGRSNRIRVAKSNLWTDEDNKMMRYKEETFTLKNWFTYMTTIRFG